MNDQTTIRYMRDKDEKFWFSLDAHLSVAEFHKKVRDRRGYVLSVGDCPVGILRYNLFWDNTPFCTLLYIAEPYRRRGYGKKLVEHWEQEMKYSGYRLALVSTRSDEEAQHFYRKSGYTDCGNLFLPGEAEELFLCKNIGNDPQIQ